MNREQEILWITRLEELGLNRCFTCKRDWTTSLASQYEKAYTLKEELGLLSEVEKERLPLLRKITELLLGDRTSSGETFPHSLSALDSVWHRVHTNPNGCGCFNPASDLRNDAMIGWGA